MKSLLMAVIAVFMLFSATCESDPIPTCDVLGSETIPYEGSKTYTLLVNDAPVGEVPTNYIWTFPDGLEVEGSASNVNITLHNPGINFSGDICVESTLTNGAVVNCCLENVTCEAPCIPSACVPTLQGVHHCLTSGLCGGGKSGVLHLGFEEGTIAQCIDDVAQVCYSISEGTFADTGNSNICFDLANGDTLPPNGEVLFCAEHCFGESFTAAINVTFSNGATQYITTLVDGGCDCN